MKITTKGQVTIPLEIREKLGFLPNTEVEFRIVGDSIRLRKVHRARGEGARGRAVVNALRGSATTRMSTEQILALTRG